LGANADEDLRTFALAAVSARVSDDPTELNNEIRKLFEAASPGHQDDLAGLGQAILAHGYIEQPLQQSPAFNYQSELKRPNHYDYGDFLVKTIDPAGWRYVPEMLYADDDLRAKYEELYNYFTNRFWNRRFDGQPYYRLVEAHHMVPI